MEDELDYLEIQDLIAEKNNILESEQPDLDRLDEIQLLLEMLY